MRFSVLGIRSDIRIELQAPVVKEPYGMHLASQSVLSTPADNGCEGVRKYI